VVWDEADDRVLSDGRATVDRCHSSGGGIEAMQQWRFYSLHRLFSAVICRGLFVCMCVCVSVCVSGCWSFCMEMHALRATEERNKEWRMIVGDILP
jgi:hypothetical protein